MVKLQLHLPQRRSFYTVALLVATATCGTPRPLEGDRGTGVHARGILDPQNPIAFHGALLAAAGWQFSACMDCHGSDFSGGASGISCLTCHPQGPTACDTCHGTQLSGAHQAHIQGTTQGQKLDCSECHPAPRDYRDPGHLFEADGSLRTGPVRVIFGALAGLPATRPPGLAPPSFALGDGGCENIYCHGAAFASPDANALRTRPTWIADAAEARCGTCHGLPPQSHLASWTRCAACHSHSASSAQTLLPGGLHLNGSIDLGSGDGTCSACHGSAQSAAPPSDLSGQSDISALGVGAHQSHLQARHRLRGPIPCTDCHLVPSRLDSPGHLDGDLIAEVFPTAAGWSSLGQADGAQPLWDRVTARCSNVYCHGGGSKLGRDTTPTLLRAPLWTQPGQAACGTCHGIPPTDVNHTPTMRLTDCARCHAATMDATGALILSGPPGAEMSTHINGTVEVM